MMMDLCKQGWTNDTADDSHCLVREVWKSQAGTEAWAGGWPLQVGGLAWKVNTSVTHSPHPYSPPLTGCLSHITVNGQVRRGRVLCGTQSMESHESGIVRVSCGAYLCLTFKASEAVGRIVRSVLCRHDCTYRIHSNI